MDDLVHHVATTQPFEDVFRDLVTIKLDSCHSTWYFHPVRMNFRRYLKGLDVSTSWRAYYGLRFDEALDGFTVVLNPQGTRLVHSWCHQAGSDVCDNCAGAAGPPEDAPPDDAAAEDAAASKPSLA